MENREAYSTKSVFDMLEEIDVSEHTEQKNGLTYLPWAWAWREVKKVFPQAQYRIYENADGWNYFTDGRTAWVKTGVIIPSELKGQEHIEYLPVMDFRNKSIPLDKITSMDVNKAIQRSLTKALARHGLGIYIYAGEDLPEGTQKTEDEPKIKNADINALKNELSKAGKAPKDLEALSNWSGYENITFRQFMAAMKELGAE